MPLRAAARVLLLAGLTGCCFGGNERHPLSGLGAGRSPVPESLAALRALPAEDQPHPMGSCRVGQEQFTWFARSGAPHSWTWAYDAEGRLAFAEDRSASDTVPCLPASTETYGERPGCEPVPLRP